MTKKLEGIYRSLPGLPCLAGCTGCCVSPTMTLSEFIHMIGFVFEKFSQHEIEKYFDLPMEPHPKFEGNFYCRFQSSEGLCVVHSHRALACRMHGLPVIDQLGVNNMENCTIMEKQFLPNVSRSTAGEWLSLLVETNKEILTEYGENFYHLIGLNVECWLDILFVDDLANDLLVSLQNVLRGSFENFRTINYQKKTEIIEKINTISLLEMVIQTGEKESVLSLLNKIESEYASTGGYFQDDCQWMRQSILQTTDKK